jgi:flagellar motor switch protein FliG
MSTRAAQSLADEMESRGRVKREEIDSAKSQIMKIAKRLAADGKIELRETSEDG